MTERVANAPCDLFIELNVVIKIVVLCAKIAKRTDYAHVRNIDYAMKQSIRLR